MRPFLCTSTKCTIRPRSNPSRLRLDCFGSFELFTSSKEESSFFLSKSFGSAEASGAEAFPSLFRNATALVFGLAAGSVFRTTIRFGRVASGSSITLRFAAPLAVSPFEELVLLLLTLALLMRDEVDSDTAAEVDIGSAAEDVYTDEKFVGAAEAAALSFSVFTDGDWLTVGVGGRGSFGEGEGRCWGGGGGGGIEFSGIRALVVVVVVGRERGVVGRPAVAAVSWCCMRACSCACCI